ncbi:MAG: redoxin domain-containing protein [Chryseolinea sp.]
MKIAAAFIFFLVTFCACSNTSTSEAKTQSETSVNEQPNMSITLIDNSNRNVRDLTGASVLIFFQPDCDHCQREAADIEKNLDAFVDTSLYFITAAPMQEIIQFARDYKLSDRSNVHFGFTPAKNILDNYGAISAPSVYIYSDKHKLVKSFNGEVAVEKILSHL